VQRVRAIIAGADEAGRGPVLGPLVVAAVAVPEPRRLAAMGVRDSKLLRADRREELDRAIRAEGRVAVRVLPAAELNRRMATATLNTIETEAFASALAELAPQRAIVDACDTDAQRFGARVARLLPPPGFPVKAEHKADTNHAVVGAASIVAKVARDAAVRAIAAEVGEDVGSGYPHDPVTVDFLKRWRAHHKGLPPHTRIYWSTVAGERPLDRRLTDMLPEAV